MSWEFTMADGTCISCGLGAWSRLVSGTSDREEDTGGSPAIQVRLSRFRGTVQQGPLQRPETQIGQPRKTLDDFLPGFRSQAIRRRGFFVATRVSAM